MSAHAHCRNCRSRLLLHQPDPHLPDRLLGTCDRCKSWYIIDAAAGLRLFPPSGESLGRLEAMSQESQHDPSPPVACQASQ
jgi:hypothetical protein